MKTWITAFSCIAAFGFALEAQAQTIDYNGSDTLQNVTNYLINNFDCGNINYLGQGSTAGETAMCNNLQESAPMSGRLNAARVCPNSPTGTASCQAQTVRAAAGGLVVGLDGLAVARHQASFRVCEDLNDWQGTLRLVYGGTDGSGSATACGAQARRDLVANWANLFVGGSCGTETCTQLRHALRRDDLSGTTSVFRSLVGISGFCNGTAPGRLNQDNDPIRVPCTAAERYCPTGNLGLVLAISVPDATASDPAGFEEATNNNTPCEFGNFAWAQAAGIGTTCLDGSRRFGPLCLYPRDSNDEFGCNNSSGNRPATAPPTFDARRFNTESRFPNGQLVAANINEFHRLAVNCEHESSTDQIGCIVGTHACYIGWAGREMFTANPTTTRPLRINGASPVVDADVISGAYPLARKLYFNTLSGFGSATNAQEQKMIACYQNSARVAEAMTASGFIPVNTLAFESLDCSPWD